MRVGLGVSTGSEVVCGAVVAVEDDATTTTDYRTLSADRQANTDTGDLVTSAIDLVGSLVPLELAASAPTIAVSYRTPEQANAIRSAVAHTRREVNLVAESTAALAFLSTTGLVDRFDTVALVDLGASGLTVSVVDRRSGTVHASDRTEQVGGDVIDDVVKDLVHHRAAPSPHDIRDYIRDDHGIGSARYRSVKEHLSTADEAYVERYSGTPLVVTRGDYEAAIGAHITSAADFARRMFTAAAHSPDVVVLFGGGARIPLLHRTFESEFDIPVLVTDEPDTILALGAAHVAVSAPTGRYPVVPVAGGDRNRALGRVSGALVAATIAGGLVLAYGVEALTPSDDSSVSPAGSASVSAPAQPGSDADNIPIVDTTPRATAAPTVSAGPTPGSNAGSLPGQGSGGVSISESSSQPGTSGQLPPATSTTLPLFPDPDLPNIPWPSLPIPDFPTPQFPTPEFPTPEFPISTTPAPPTVTTPPPTETPGESTESPGATTPEAPESGLPALTPPSVPTTDVGAAPETTPELSPPPTVWKPPVELPSSGSADGTREESAAPSATPSQTPAPTSSPEPTA